MTIGESKDKFDVIQKRVEKEWTHKRGALMGG
jgi:hypothetical protein